MSWAQQTTAAAFQPPAPSSLQQQQQQTYTHSNKFVSASSTANNSNNMPNTVRAQQQQQQQQYVGQQQALPPTVAATAYANQQQLPKTWPQQNHQQPNKIMQPATAANNWPQQQQLYQPAQPPQQQQQQVTNANAFATWPQQQPYQPAAAGTNTNYFAPVNAAAPTQIYAQPAAAATAQQNSLPTQDGWDGWDEWNESNNTNTINTTSNNNALQANYNHGSVNANVIESSFNTQSSDSWSWDIASADANANAAVNEHSSSSSSTAPIVANVAPTAAVPMLNAQQAQLLNKTNAPTTQQSSQQQQHDNYQVPASVPLQFAVATATAVKANINTKPTTLPLTSEVSNDNYNSTQTSTAAAAALSHNSVYVSQAKPVARPSRQYASPPGGLTPDESPESILAPPPPQAFQNDIKLPPPTMSVTATNPFKRAGAAQHHRANIMPTTTTTTTATSAVANNFIGMPPPPADFANPILSIEPDNSEILHENQEVIAPLNVGNITLPGHAATQPLNDERNQYLQTSHLSENPDDELNLDADNLPPPGLSRLVLGQPELEASTQRLVTGTEEPAVIGNNMHIEERHADGEDNSLEQQMLMPTSLNATTSSSSSSSSSATSNTNIDVINTDRNLYLVPGESHASNEQRVVTGLDTTLTTTASNQIINEQRDITLDGENLEDQQQAAAAAAAAATAVISVGVRNEPPLEGASSNAEIAVALPAAVSAAQLPLQHAADLADTHATAASSKDFSNQSTGNDESDILPEQPHHSRYGGKTQRQKQHEQHERKSDLQQQQQQQRKPKQRSSERFETEESEEEMYSSERERERVRSERDERERGSDKRRRDKRKIDANAERDKQPARDKYYQRGGAADVHKSERRSQRYNRYADDSTEEYAARKEHSRRQDERAGRSDRSDRDYDEYNRRYRGSKREKANSAELERERRERYVDDDRSAGKRRQRRERERDDYDTIERRRRHAANKQHAVDPRDYEEYRKQSSRNARESDLEKERLAGMRADPRQMYGYSTAGYGFDPYTFYYEQMARTNPQAYAEWYKKYFGQATAAAAGTGSLTKSAVDHMTATDGRESVHSGRSSAQNERERYTQAYISQANEYHRHYYHHQQQQQQQQQQLAMMLNNSSNQNNATMNKSKSMNSNLLLEDNNSSYHGSVSNLSQIHSTNMPTATSLSYGGSGHYYAGIGLNLERAYYARSEYAESRTGNLSLRDQQESNVPDPQRLTPYKFVNEHTVVSLSAGIIVTAKPKYTPHGSISTVVKIQRLGAHDATRQLYQSFPGPLVRGLTHKKTIIEFCEEQIRLGPVHTTIYGKQLLSVDVEKYRASYTLMWKLLILLLRQNGMVVGTDIAELLLKNQQQFPYTTLQQHSSAESLADAKLQNENAEVAVDETAVEASTESQQDTAAINTPTLSETEITERFRNYLLYGNVNEALDWATDNNLWGHALFLASKLDRRSHANIMMKFANKLSLNDPLQTLYQLMSGRMPSSVTSVQDEKWGDWRPHLSMILSNTSQKPELDRKAITTLGDTLLNRGDLFAAHFCYLMAQVGFGRYQTEAALEVSLQSHLPKLVLLGSSHYKQFNEFATDEAIMMTEIYEYACSLNDEKFSLIEFQPYKYLLATRLLDYGYHLRSLMYLEQIALHIQRDPSKYEPLFIQKIFEFADQLKYYDPVLDKSMDEQQQQTVDGVDDSSNNNNVPNFEEQKWLQSLRTLAAQQVFDYDAHNANNDNSNNADAYQTQTQIDQQFMELNKQFNELNLQYSEMNAAAATATAVPPTFYNTETMQQTQQQANVSLLDGNQLQQPTPQLTNNAYEQQTYVDSLPAAQTQQTANDVSYAGYEQMQNSYYDPTQHQQQQQQINYDANSGAYDYWQQQQQQPAYGDETAAMTKPQISMPKSKAYESDEEHSKQQQTKTNVAANKNNAAQQQGKAANSSNKDANKVSQQNSGWFGGIWNKLSMKPKNQMILPDDKNPSIVWDAAQKRWINTDGDETNEENVKPPPKMSDIVQQAYGEQQQTQQQQQQQHQQQQQQQMPYMDVQQQQQLQPPYGQMPALSAPLNTSTLPTANAYAGNASNVAAPTATTDITPKLQSNMFKMQRNRTLKNSYVDVFNPSGAPMSTAAENVLAPTLPPAAVPQSGFFIPAAAAVPAAGHAEQQHQQQQQQQQQQSQMSQQEVPQFYNPNQYGAATGSY